MKCNEIEKSIYLYKELSPPERNILDAHLAQCPSCRALADQVIESRSTVNQVRRIMPEIENPERVTQRIMRTIGAQSKIGLWSQITAYVDTVFVRYAFSFASLVLILFFVSEQSVDSQLNNVIDKKIEITQASILNTRAISNNYLMKRKSNGQAFSRYTYYKQNANH